MNKYNIKKFVWLGPVYFLPTVAPLAILLYTSRHVNLGGDFFKLCGPIALLVVLPAILISIALHYLVSNNDNRKQIFIKTIFLTTLSISLYFFIFALFLPFTAPSTDGYADPLILSQILGFGIVPYFCMQCLRFKPWARKCLMAGLAVTLLLFPLVGYQSLLFIMGDSSPIMFLGFMFTGSYLIVWLMCLISLFVKPIKNLFKSKEITSESNTVMI